jgi:hypothetical protein
MLGACARHDFGAGSTTVRSTASSPAPESPVAEVGATEERGTTLAARDLARAVQELVDLGETSVDAHDGRCAFRKQILAKAAAPVHLDQQAADVLEGVVARLQERAPLAAKQARVRVARSDAYVPAPAKEGHARRV